MDLHPKLNTNLLSSTQVDKIPKAHNEQTEILHSVFGNDFKELVAMPNCATNSDGRPTGYAIVMADTAPVLPAVFPPNSLTRGMGSVEVEVPNSLLDSKGLMSKDKMQELCDYVTPKLGNNASYLGLYESKKFGLNGWSTKHHLITCTDCEHGNGKLGEIVEKHLKMEDSKLTSSLTCGDLLSSSEFTSIKQESKAYRKELLNEVAKKFDMTVKENTFEDHPVCEITKSGPNVLFHSNSKDGVAIHDRKNMLFACDANRGLQSMAVQFSAPEHNQYKLVPTSAGKKPDFVKSDITSKCSYGPLDKSVRERLMWDGRSKSAEMNMRAAPQYRKIEDMNFDKLGLTVENKTDLMPVCVVIQ